MEKKYNCPICKLDGVNRKANVWYLGINLCTEHQYYPLYKMKERLGKDGYRNLLTKHY